MEPREIVVDPATGQEYVIAVEAVRDTDAGRQVTGRVVRPRRARGSLITMTVPAQVDATAPRGA